MKNIDTQKGLTFAHGMIAGALSAVLLLAVAVWQARADESCVTLEYSTGQVQTKGHWIPMGGSYEFRESTDDIDAIRIGCRVQTSFDWLAVHGSFTKLSPFTQTMIGTGADGLRDSRYVRTESYILGLTLEPHYGPFFIRYGAGLGIFRQELSWQRGASFTKTDETQTGMVNLFSAGGRFARHWTLTVDVMKDLVFRNSDLGGPNQRRERRHAHFVSIGYEF